MATSLKPSRRRRGFTLAEVLLASAILAFSVAALTQAIVVGQAHAYDSIHSVRAVSLLEATMAEVMSKAYFDPDDAGLVAPGPDTGETSRSLYDNHDDYHGFSEATGALTDHAGNAYPSEYARFTRTVSTSYRASAVTVYTLAYPGIEVTVTVTDDHGQSWTLTRLTTEPAP